MIKFILESPTASEFRLEVDKELSGPLKLNYQTIYNLEAAIPQSAICEGVTWDIPMESLTNPVAYELMLHAAYLKVVYDFWPRSNPRSPFGSEDLPINYEQHFNMLRNLSVFNQMSHLKALTNSAKGSNVIVAMPGPSLDPEFIRKHQDTCVTIGSGRAIRTLIKAGVRPDVYWIQDTNPAAYEDILTGLEGDMRPGGIVVANPAGPMVDYHDKFDSLYKAWNAFPFETDTFEKIEEIPPSSGTGAYSIAKLMGARTITFTGCDSGSCMTGEQRNGFSDYYSNLLDSDPFANPEDIMNFSRDIFLTHGKSLAVRTQSNYLACAQWMKSRAMKDRIKHDLRVFDASETRMLTFNSVIDEADEALLQGGTRFFRPGRFAHTNEVKPFAQLLLKNYRIIEKYLQPGKPVPGTSLKPPFNCIFFQTGATVENRFIPTQEQYDMASSRLQELIETLNPIASE